MFIQNIWYVAAWADEVGSTPWPTRIIGKPLVIFRQANGDPVALEDICPHRFAPLSRGKLVGDTIECGYHGLRFGAGGHCVYNPHIGTGEPHKGVRAYPLVERDRLLWIWMGQSEAADESLIPRFPWLNEFDRFEMTKPHSMEQAIGYELITDNLLDLSHGAYLHPTTLGSEEMANGTSQVRQEGDRIHYQRFNPRCKVPKLFWMAGVIGEGESVDFWNDMRWDPPGAFYLEVGVTEPGQTRDRGYRMGSVHILTPHDETSTTYRWLVFRNFARDDSALTESIEALVEYAFRREDEPMLLAVQERMARRDFWDMHPLMFPGDKAAIFARRTIRRLAAL
ncbi:MAG: aromatic ring-hydroxylating dioxygenase subunit alpha [Pseudomonadota bacterium]|nr:aromatic ring-hydroxylating dioxygenase subunit alpha [Pseudomonadota bacterium]